ncbi:glycosyltransferase domain-containing protein [Erwinia sp. MYb416]|uniref:glycosyltransferase domain-containing protein n=1 Tax=Erwinia sp. MYb416 TaxID=3108532 RepID=UPI00309D69D5
MNKRVVYTAIFGDYDDLLEPDYVDSSIDYICFTNNKSLKSSHWIVKYVDNFNGVTDNARLNRIYKFMPHRFLSDYDESLYIDGNIKIAGKNLSNAFDFALKNKMISIPPHAERECIYEESLACLRLGKGEPDRIKKQMQFYKNEGFPEKYGLYENNIIFRKHGCEKIKTIMEEWLEMITKFSSRDQLSLCYLFWKSNIPCEAFLWGPKFSGKFFKIKFHNTEKKLPLLKKIILYLLINEKRNIFYSSLCSVLIFMIKIKKHFQ